MRNAIFSGLILVVVGVMGCGSGNKAKAEKLNREILAEFKAMIVPFENGDKASIDKSFEKIKSLFAENKNLKITQKEADSMKGMADEMKKAGEDCVAAMQKGMTNGKWKPSDLMEVGQKFQSLDSMMK
jgi:hypothetical protein